MDLVAALAGVAPKSAPQTTDTAISEYSFLMPVIRVISISAISYIGFFLTHELLTYVLGESWKIEGATTCADI